MKKKLFTFLPLGILALFIITNPSVKDFKDYLGENSYGGLHRTSNYFVASSYRMGGFKYIGFFGNFWKEEPKYYFKSFDNAVKDSLKIDSTRIIDSSVHTDPFAKYGGHEIKK